MGRTRKPTALKIIEGNPGKRPLPKNEPKPPVGTTRPRGLGAEARKEWDRVYPILEDQLILTELDRETLVTYCESLELVRRARRTLRRDGMTTDGKFGEIASPWVTILRQAEASMRAAAGDLGMTPASRSKVTKTGDDRKRNKFALVDGTL